MAKTHVMRRGVEAQWLCDASITVRAHLTEPNRPVPTAGLQSAGDIEFATVARGEQISRSFIAEARVTF
jgi:hypothetical protein